LVCGAGIEHLRDGRVVHQSQSLAFGFESRHHFARAHPRFHEFDCDAPPYGRLLLSQPDFAHAPFADFLEQVVTVDNHPRCFTGVHCSRVSQGGFV
jgi:hypothetical protein